MTEFLQQLLNGLSLGAIYALIAIGYTMVYGVLRFINFAHSDVFMLGAFAGYYLAPVVARVFPPGSIAGALVVLVSAMAICAGIGVTIEYLAYRPLRRRPRLTVLITAIGVSLLIEFTCQHRLVFGPSPRTFPDLIPTRTLEIAGLSLGTHQILVFLLTALLLAGLTFVVQSTRVGMAMRAVSFNEQAAALMGVNINRIISFTFALGSALAGAGGVLAALGGLVIGIVETFAGGIQGLSNYRDGIAFAVLILILLFRPAGLLGRAQVEKV